MSEFVAWNSQSLERWAERYAQGKFVELGGHRTHYLERGEGPPLILLHGFFYDSFLWAENIDALSRRFRVYALDLWGCGFSTREPLDYGYPLYAEQLRLFMDAMGVERAALVGQSMGAGAAIKFCVAHRDRVDRLILVSAAGLPNPQPLMARFFNLPGVGEFFLNLRTDLFRTVGLKTSFIHDPKLITPDYFGHATRAHKIEGSIEAGLKILRSDFFGTLADEVRTMGTLDVPTLLVWGREDKSQPLRVARQMHALLPGSRLDILDRAAHVSNFERAEEFNRLALEFLSG